MAKMTVKDSTGADIEVDITVDILPKEVKDQIIQQANGIAYGNIDAKIEALGFTKQNGEKTSEFINRILSEQMSKLESLENSKPDLAKFEQTISELKAELKQKNQELKLKDEEVSTRLLQKDIEAQVKQMTSNITVPQYLTEQDEIDAFIRTQEELIMSKLQNNYKAKQVDGKIQFIGKDGNIVENSDRDLASVKDIVSKDFGFLFKKVDTQNQNNNNQQGNTGKPNPDPAIKSTSYEESVVLVEKEGLRAGTREFFDRLREINQANGIEA